MVRRQRKRLLTHGAVAQGSIDSVSTGSLKIKGQQQYEVRFSFNVDDLPHTATCHAYGQQARLAESLLETNTPVRVLYEPRSPQRALVLDLLAVEGL